MRPNKLECSYLTITFQSSLTFAGNTRSLSKKEASERSYNWVAPALPTNFKAWLERVSKDKPSSLLGLIVSDEGKQFNNIDTWSDISSAELLVPALVKLEKFGGSWSRRISVSGGLVVGRTVDERIVRAGAGKKWRSCRWQRKAGAFE